MASLKKKIIISFAASLAIFLVFVSAVIFSGLNIAIKGWYRASESRYASTITKTLEKLYSSEKDPGPEMIRNSLEGELSDLFSLMVVSPGGNILLAHNLKRPPLPPGYSSSRLPPPPGTGFEQPPGMGSSRRMQEGMGFHMMRPEAIKEMMKSLNPVYVRGEPVAYIWVRSAHFETDDAINRKLINTVLTTLLFGITSAFAAAVFSTSVISGKITKEATKVSSGLEMLASGKRDLSFGESSLKEISSINRSASILQERLIREEEAEKQWTQDIAHDLRTPTTAIKAQLEAMLDGILKPEKKRLEKLLAETNRLEALIEDINRLTKIESPQLSLSAGKIPAAEIADMLSERFSIQAEEKKIKLEILNNLEYINCDFNLITRALSNLVQNSITYSPEGSAVTVSMMERFSGAEKVSVITVENPGFIPEKEIEKIFDRLYRGEFSRSSSGTGLGLTIAKAAVEKHGGTLSAENIEKGERRFVRFTLALPDVISGTHSRG